MFINLLCFKYEAKVKPTGEKTSRVLVKEG